MALERLQHRIPFLLYTWQHSYPSGYTAVEILSYYAPCQCEYEGAAVRMERSLLDSVPIIENEPLRIVDNF